MSTTVRNTPQTRSQTKKVASRVSTLATHHSSQSDDVPQSTIILNIVGMSIFLVLLTYGFFKYHKSVVKTPKMPQILDRLVYTLQMQTFSFIPLIICLKQVMFTRLLTAARNPLSGNEKVVEKGTRILTNTLEQLILNVFNQLILVTFLPAQNLFVIPFLVFVFTFGRILYIIGYNIHPKFRTFGFVLSYLPSFIILCINLVYALGMNRYLAILNPPDLPSHRKVEL